MAQHVAKMAERELFGVLAPFRVGGVYRLPKVIAVTGCPRTAVYQMLDRKSPRHDPLFPRPFALSERTVGWLADEVHAWVETRAATRL